MVQVVVTVIEELADENFEPRVTNYLLVFETIDNVHDWLMDPHIVDLQARIRLTPETIGEAMTRGEY